MNEVDTSDIHWFWLGSIRAVSLIAAGLVFIPLLPLAFIAVLGGYEGGRLMDLSDKATAKVDAFALWSWQKMIGEKKP